MENTAGLKLLQEGYEGVALTKIFPAKGFYPSTAGGAWYAAKLVEEENRLQLGKKEGERVTYSRLKKQRVREAKKQRLYEKGEDILAETQSEADERATHLDGFYLLRLHGVSNPNDLSAVDISGKPLETANDEDLELFDNVIYVNAAETLLRLETFNHFSSLQELEAPLCALKSIRINLNDFEYLQILDLSYNNLTPEDVGALSILPKLRALYLTGNALTHLPINLCSNVLFKSDESSANATEVEAFPCLELLHLDSNEFESPETLAVLAGLKQLKSLNLDNNALPAIPYIKIAHGKPIERFHVNEVEFGNEENEDTGDNDFNVDDVLSSVTDGLDLASKMTTSNEGNEPVTEQSDEVKASDSKIDALSDDALNAPGNSIIAPTDGASAEDMDESNSDGKPPPPPFPELRILSIAHNKITSEDGVLPVVGWPMLQEINLIGNPIVATYKGEPPLINRYLTQRLGITVKRFAIPFKEKGVIDNGEIVQATDKPPIHRTVKEVVPPMKRRPIDFMAIEYPGVFDPLPSRDATPNYGDRAKAAMEEGVILPPNNLPPEMRPISTQQPLPPIREESKVRPKSGPEDYQHMRKAPPELNRFSTEDVLLTNTNDKTDKHGAKPVNDDNEPFFLTQINEDGEKEFVDMSEEPVEVADMKPKRYIKKVPRRLKPFQLLYQTDEDEDKYSITLPKDVHSNVKALKYALKHPLTVSEGSVKHEQALMQLYQPDKYRRAARPKIVRKTKTELFYDTLSDLRNRVGYIETNLEKVLAESNMKKVNDVAVLVSEIQEKYKQSTDKF